MLLERKRPLEDLLDYLTRWHRWVLAGQDFTPHSDGMGDEVMSMADVLLGWLGLISCR